MRQECKHFESRTYANGDTVRKCDLDLAPDAPWRCPDNCPSTSAGWPTVAWTHGSLVAPADAGRAGQRRRRHRGRAARRGRGLPELGRRPGQGRGRGRAGGPPPQGLAAPLPARADGRRRVSPTPIVEFVPCTRSPRCRATSPASSPMPVGAGRAGRRRRAADPGRGDLALQPHRRARPRAASRPGRRSTTVEGGDGLVVDRPR